MGSSRLIGSKQADFAADTTSIDCAIFTTMCRGNGYRIETKDETGDQRNCKYDVYKESVRLKPLIMELAVPVI